MHPGSTDLNGRKTVQPNQDRPSQTPVATGDLNREADATCQSPCRLEGTNQLMVSALSMMSAPSALLFAKQLFGQSIILSCPFAQRERPPALQLPPSARLEIVQYFVP